MDAKRADGPKLIQWLVAAQRGLCVFLVAALAGLILVQVVARYVFDAPLGWSEEVGRFVFIWLAFMAGSFVMGEGRHIAVDVIGRWVGRRGRVMLEVLAAAVAATVAGVLVVAAAPYVWRMMAVESPAAHIPRGLWIAATLVGLTLMGFHAVVNAAVATRRGEPIWAQNLGAEAELDVDRLQEHSPADAAEGMRERSHVPEDRP